MKKAVFTIITLLCSCIIYSQTLTNENSSPIPGDKFYYYFCNTLGVSQGDTGLSQIWDFSTLVNTKLDSAIYLSCTETPAFDSFPESNISYKYNNVYSYFITNSTEYKMLGYYVDDTSHYCLHYTDRMVGLMYPVSYGTLRKDTIIMNAGIYRSILYYSFKADAQGIVYLPNGDYTNVLRVKRVTEGKTFDTVSGELLGHNYQCNYDWFIEGYHNPILTIGYMDTSESTLQIRFMYYTSSTNFPVGIKNNTTHSKSKISIYPNPANNFLFISLDPYATKTPEIKIIDILGKQYILNHITEGDKEKIDVSNLNNGTYRVLVNYGNRIEEGAFVKAN